MFSALKGAFKDVFSSRTRKLLWFTAGVTLLIFILLFVGFSFLITNVQFFDKPWMENLFRIFGYLIFFVLSLVMFPAVATFVAGLFIDSVVDRLTSSANRSKLRNVPLAESVKSSGILAIKGVAVTSLLIPVTAVFSFIPLVNLVPVALYYVFNGRILAQEYYSAVALRYMNASDSKQEFNKNKKYWEKAGIIISFLMTIPVVNIISPLVAMAFMRRLFLKKHEQGQQE